MANSVRITNGEGLQSVDIKRRDSAYALTVATTPLLESLATGRPFLNPTFGIAMNQDVSFGGIPELIHDGGDNVGWTGAAGAGTWDFADTTAPQAGSAHVSVTSANNNDFASFTDGTEVDMGSYTAFTGQIQLVMYDNTLNTILLQPKNNGSNVGNTVNMANYINAGTLGSYQGFVIPKADLGLNGSTIDEIEIIITRTGGGKPTVYFDVMQIEQTGAPLEFKVTPKEGTRFHITKYGFHIADVGTGGTAYAYNKLGALAALPNGITLAATLNGVNIFSSTVRQLSDFFFIGCKTLNHVDDGTNTFITLELPPPPKGDLILDSREGDKVVITINDDLSGLLLFSVFAQGAEEMITDK